MFYFTWGKLQFSFVIKSVLRSNLIVQTLFFVLNCKQSPQLCSLHNNELFLPLYIVFPALPRSKQKLILLLKLLLVFSHMTFPPLIDLFSVFIITAQTTFGKIIKVSAATACVLKIWFHQMHLKAALLWHECVRWFLFRVLWRNWWVFFLKYI